MRRTVFFIFSLLLCLSVSGQAPNSECNNALVFCGQGTQVFQSVTNSGEAQSGPCYGCITSGRYNPGWYFLQIDQAGIIEIRIQPKDSVDIDFICWGPFDTPTGECENGLTCFPVNTVVSCSFSPNHAETCVIPMGIPGKFYILLLTNFENTTTDITLNQRNLGGVGAGSTNCTIVLDCSILSLTSNPTVCIDDYYNLSGTIEFTNPPATGILVIEDNTSSPPKQAIFNPPFNSPQAYTITDIPCDGLVHDLTASFSDAVDPCSFLTSYTAPAATCPSGIISGGGTICDNGISQATVLININGPPGPYNITYAINGVNQPTISNYNGPFPYQFSTMLPGLYTLAELSTTDCPGGGTTAGSATVTLNPLPTATISGTTSICPGNSTTLSIALSGTPPWNLTYFNGTTPVDVNGITTGLYTFTVSPLTATTYIVTIVSDATTCTNNGTGNAVVTINPLPMVDFSGPISPATVCQNYPTPARYQVASDPSTTFSWTIPPPFTSKGIVTPIIGSPNMADVIWTGTGNAQLKLDGVTNFGCQDSKTKDILILPKPEVILDPCFDQITNRSAKRFLLKGGTPLLTSTPLQGEYLCNPPTAALSSDASGNFYFNPALVTGTNTRNFDISYRYTSSQYECIATSPSVTLTVMAANPVSCSSSMTDVRDGTVYSTALLPDGKCWMTQNLRYGTLLSPSTLPQTDNCTVEKYCLSSDPACIANGGFYQWDELIQFGNTDGPAYQGVCPPGWHVPTRQEWQDLINFYAPGDGVAGGFLKDQNLANGFRALLKGIYYLNNTWAFESGNSLTATMFWTATPSSLDLDRAFARGMNNYNYSVSLYPSSKANAFPVRCMKD